MDPKLKAFLSSAQYQDEFVVERDLLELLFNKEPLYSSFCLWKIENQASPLEIDDHYLSHVKNSDLLIILLGKVLRDAVKSEFETALSNNIPIFAFIRECRDRSQNMQIFINKNIFKEVSACNYSNSKELPHLVEESLLQYYYHQSPSHTKYHVPISDQETKEEIRSEEKSLRLLVGIISTEYADITRDKIFEALIYESLMINDKPKSIKELHSYIQKITKSEKEQIKDDFLGTLNYLATNKYIHAQPDDKFQISKEKRDELLNIYNRVDKSEIKIFKTLYGIDPHISNLVNYDDFRLILQHSISQIIYNISFSLAEVEFYGDKIPVPYDSEEINRIVGKSLSTISELPGGISTWQPIIVDILKSKNKDIINWFNRLRKSYWLLATLGCEPYTIDYKFEHITKYVIYFDSHIIIRAMVEAGGGSELCCRIIELSKSLGIDVRLSYPLFQEVKSAFSSANSVYWSSDQDITRALSIHKNLNRKTDIFEGFINARSQSKLLKWEEFINKYYSPIDDSKIKNYIENELGVEVKPEYEFDTEKLGRIEEITEFLLQQRKVGYHDGFTYREYISWEKQFRLRTNEARQMSIIYELRSSEKDNKQYWFVTFDNFVYEVSVELLKSGGAFYGFPCYMKPARWLEILVNASPKYINVNTFREIMISPAMNYVADFVESEVISQMLKSRVDQNIQNINTLRYMFADIVNRPAIQDAYNELMKSSGSTALKASVKVKDEVIIALGEELDGLKKALKEKDEIITQKTEDLSKTKGREQYYKKQWRRTELKLKKPKKKKLR